MRSLVPWQRKKSGRTDTGQFSSSCRESNPRPWAPGFRKEPLALPISLEPGALQEAMPGIMAALGREMPSGHLWGPSTTGNPNSLTRKNSPTVYISFASPWYSSKHARVPRLM
ncbi:MAG: hypothetical protein JXJ04_08560 [Spirochaetales bacterium]|nr:hypothetical protein [Spirochaetales bacterium]